MHITIGSRGSDLALWQAHFVKDELEKLGHTVTINIIVTRGDQIQDLSFDKIEGKGFFTKEIETALLNQEIDLAVHSHKDLETTPPKGLIIGAVSARENPTDLLLINPAAVDKTEALHLKKQPVVGTSSARRKSQLIRVREDVTLKDLRGNVPTRIQKLRDGHYDAIVLASAGIKRLELDLSDLYTLELDAEQFVPAPAQGVLALQIRETDLDLQHALAALNHPNVAEAIGIERAVLRQLEGGCQLPLGVYCEKKEDLFRVHVSYAANGDSSAQVSVYETTAGETIAQLIVEDIKGGETD